MRFSTWHGFARIVPVAGLRGPFAVPVFQYDVIGPELRDKVFPPRVDDHADQREQYGFLDLRAQPLDKLFRLDHIDQRVTERAIVGQRRASQRFLERGEPKARRQAAAQQRYARPSSSPSIAATKAAAS